MNLEKFPTSRLGHLYEVLLDGCRAEHYRLLAYLSTCYSNSTIIDLGTDKGCSALALSHNPSNHVISYDIEDRKVQPIDLPNIEFRLKDATEDRDELLASALILLDTAHNGVFEQKVYSTLVAGRYDGLLLLDDISPEPDDATVLGEDRAGEDRPHASRPLVRDGARSV